MLSPTEGKDESDSVVNKSGDGVDKQFLRMQLSTQVLQKLLKEGKMEKLPTGSFRISADALKELEQDGESKSSLKKGVFKRKLSETNESESDNEEEDVTPKKTKLGMPKKKNSGINKFSSVSGTGKEHTLLKNKKDTKKTTVKSDPVEDAEQVSAQLSETSAKHDEEVHGYVSDFNSSEEEDEETINSLRDSIAELVPRKKNHLSKNMNLLFEQLHKSIFGNISDDSDDEFEKMKQEEIRTKSLSLKEPDFNESEDTATIPDEFCLEGRIGADGKTKMCIRSSNKTKSFDGVEHPVYNIETGVGSVTTITPLTVTSCKTSKTHETSEVSDNFFIILLVQLAYWIFESRVFNNYFIFVFSSEFLYYATQ